MSTPSLPKQEQQSWYARQKQSWQPWIEDHILSWFGENKTSYVAKDKLSQTKITGNRDVDAAQDNVNSSVAGELGKGGNGQAVGDALSKEGMNRAERGGKGEKGGVF